MLSQQLFNWSLLTWTLCCFSLPPTFNMLSEFALFILKIRWKKFPPWEERNGCRRWSEANGLTQHSLDSFLPYQLLWAFGPASHCSGGWTLSVWWRSRCASGSGIRPVLSCRPELQTSWDDHPLEQRHAAWGLSSPGTRGQDWSKHTRYCFIPSTDPNSFSWARVRISL